MDKELLVKVWILIVLVSFVLAFLASYLLISPFWLFAGVFAAFSILGIIISVTAISKKIKFSGLLLILIIVTGIYVSGVAFWAFISPYCCTPPPKYIQIMDYSCINHSRAWIIIRNGENTQNINTLCSIPLSGNTGKCGELAITKNTGGNFNSASLSSDSINPGETVTFTDTCGINNNCSYTFSTNLITISGEGRIQQNVTLIC